MKLMSLSTKFGSKIERWTLCKKFASSHPRRNTCLFCSIEGNESFAAAVQMTRRDRSPWYRSSQSISCFLDAITVPPQPCPITVHWSRPVLHGWCASGGGESAKRQRHVNWGLKCSHVRTQPANDQRQRRAATVPAKRDDADRRVRCTLSIGTPSCFSVILITAGRYLSAIAGHAPADYEYATWNTAMFTNLASSPRVRLDCSTNTQGSPFVGSLYCLRRQSRLACPCLPL